jgi:tetraacyldisaccharide 4'-kinase
MRIWMRRGVVAWALTPVAVLFLLAASLRRRLYQLGFLPSTRLAAPVVVVGNVFIGGTGKTPFTIWLVEALRALGYTPGVISRGYGTRVDSPVAVDVEARVAAVGDEPLLIAARARCPVFVGRDRVAAAQALLASHPQVNLIVSDDGLQHYALQRDVEIVLCDERGNGNGWLLPAGPLREPAGRVRDFTVVNANYVPHDAPATSYLMRLRATHAERLGDRADSVALGALAAASDRIAAVAGIGNPARFFATLRGAGVKVHDEIALPDHYDYAHNPFDGLLADLILITEKDAVKCVQLEPIRNDSRLWVVPVSVQIDPALAHRIVEKCRGFPPA